MERLKKHPKITVIIILHLVGLIGLSTWLRESLVMLSSINLLITAALLFDELRTREGRYITALVVLFVLGMTVEIVGVQTGFPFGEYSYGTVLGPKVGGVSLIIGVNWFYLVVCAVAAVRFFTSNKWLIILLAPAILTGMDVLIEPVAIALDYWQWEAVAVPLSNYIAWFAVSIPMVFIYLALIPNPPSRLPAQVLLVQIVFFAVLNITLP